MVSLAASGLVDVQDAVAGSGAGRFFETLGVSTAVGVVLGASTLPFYEVPGDQLANVGYGALAGLGVGIGILVVDWLSPSAPSQELAQEMVGNGLQPGKRGRMISTGLMRVSSAESSASIRPIGQRGTTFWAPIFSKTF